MTARVAPTSKARNGDTVRVAFDPHKVHLFDIETELTIPELIFSDDHF